MKNKKKFTLKQKIQRVVAVATSLVAITVSMFCSHLAHKKDIEWIDTQNKNRQEVIDNFPNQIPLIKYVYQFPKESINFDELSWQEAIKAVKTPAEAQDYLNTPQEICLL